MGKYKRLAGDTFIFALGNLGSKLILFLLVPLYTNYLTKSEYGTAELVYTASNLIMPVTSLVIFDGVLRYTLDKRNNQKSVILNAGIIFVGGSILSIMIAPLVGLYPSLHEWKWYVSLYVITFMATQITMTTIKAKEKTRLYALLGVAQTLLLALLNIFLLVFLHLKITGYLLANICANGVIALIALFAGGIINDLKEAVFDKKLFFEMAAYSTPLILNNISWWVIQSSDKLMIEFFISSAALGLYTAASKIPALINVINSIFSQSWGISSIKEYDSTKDTTFYSNVFSLYCFTVFLFCACLLLIIKPFMHVYVGADFIESWRYVPWLLVAASFSAVAAFFGAVYGALMKSFNVMISTLLSAIINFFLNLFLIPRIGIIGATTATAISYCFLALYRMIDTRHYFKFKINFFREFFNYLAVCVSAFFVTIDQYGYAVAAMVIVLIILVNYCDMKRLIVAGFQTLRLRKDNEKDRYR